MMIQVFCKKINHYIVRDTIYHFVLFFYLKCTVLMLFGSLLIHNHPGHF